MVASYFSCATLRRLAFTLALFGSLIHFSACSTAPDVVELSAAEMARTQLNELQERLDNGGEISNIEIDQLVAHLDDLPVALQQQVVGLLVSSGSDHARAKLREYLIDPDYNQSSLQNSIVMSFIAEGSSDSAELMLDSVLVNPPLLSNVIIDFWGESRYIASMLRIVDSLERGEFSQSGSRALAKLNHSEANHYLIGAAGQSGHRSRLSAIESLALIEHPEDRQAAIRQLRRVAEEIQEEGPSLRIAAIHTLTTMDRSVATQSSLKEIFRNDRNAEEVRREALKALAAILGQDPELVAQELEFSLLDGQTEADLQARSDRSRERERAREREREELEAARRAAEIAAADAKRAQARAAATRQPPARTAAPAPDRSLERGAIRVGKGNYPSGERYRQRVRLHIHSAVGAEMGVEMERRIHNALQAYARSNNPWSEFIVRSYEREFDANSDASRELMRSGLSHPGSLHAVVGMVVENYDSPEMRAYTLSRIFSLPRWQGEVLLQIGTRSSL